MKAVVEGSDIFMFLTLMLNYCVRVLNGKGAGDNNAHLGLGKLCFMSVVVAVKPVFKIFAT